MSRPVLVFAVFALLAGGAAAMIVAQRGAIGATDATDAAHARNTPPQIDAGKTAQDASVVRPGRAQDASTDEPAATSVSPGLDELVLDESNQDAGGTLPDGAVVPEPGEGPKSVVFGVVLVQYQGAQGARPGARSRAEAHQLAQQLRDLGTTDFKAAVEKGDPGSTENAGRMFRGILEPAPEYVLFDLEKEAVGGPVDTPRGFWVVRRIE